MQILKSILGNSDVFDVEATELLLYDKIIDSTAHLCIWQPGMIGNRSVPRPNQTNNHLKLLRKKLIRLLPDDHREFFMSSDVPRCRTQNKQISH